MAQPTEQPAGQPKKKIRRTRTGCFTCRRRRIKCDERKPFCKACGRLGIQCHGYAPKYRFAEEVVPVQRKEQNFQSLQIKEWSANLEPFDFQALDISSVGEEPRISSPLHGSEHTSTTEATDNDSAISSLGQNLGSSKGSGVLLAARKSDSSFVENFYLAKWYTCVGECLPPIFRDITTDMQDFLPLRSAVLAISASYLAHIESSTVMTNVGRRRSRYVPQSEHRYRSLEFYDRGVRELAELVLTSQPAKINYVLATSLLFHYFEIDSGSVVGAGGHMESIDNIVLSAYEELNTNLTGQKLLCTWIVLRSLVVSRRLSIGMNLAKLPSSVSSNDLDYIMSKAGTPYDSIMRLLCTSLSLIRIILLDWCVCRGKSFLTPEMKYKAFSAVLSQVSLPESRDCSISELVVIDEAYWKSFEEQRKKLDEWHSRLDISDLPMDSFTSQTVDIIPEDTTSSPQVPPLRFRTHEAAMNYIYYALAQCVSSRRVLERLASADAPPPTFTSHSYPWEHLILRIAAGVDPTDCVAKHMFKFGIMSILSMSAGICPHQIVAEAAEHWVSQLEVCGLAVEDGMPLAIIKRELSFVAEKKKKGQDILRVAVFTTTETETGELYQSDFQLLSAVCAKDRLTGKLYNDICEIP